MSDNEVQLPFDPDLITNVLAVLVERAGGEIRITQSEFGSIVGSLMKCYGRCGEAGKPEATDYVRITNEFIVDNDGVILQNRPGARP